MADNAAYESARGLSRRCACGAPERCWPDSETCAFDDTGFPWCRVCKTNHRAPECALDAESAPARTPSGEKTGPHGECVGIPLPPIVAQVWPPEVAEALRDDVLRQLAWTENNPAVRAEVIPFPAPRDGAENTTCECGGEWFTGGAVVLDASSGSVTGRTVDDWQCASCDKALT